MNDNNCKISSVTMILLKKIMFMVQLLCASFERDVRDVNAVNCGDKGLDFQLCRVGPGDGRHDEECWSVIQLDYV